MQQLLATHWSLTIAHVAGSCATSKTIGSRRAGIGGFHDPNLQIGAGSGKVDIAWPIASYPRVRPQMKIYFALSAAPPRPHLEKSVCEAAALTGRDVLSDPIARLPEGANRMTATKKVRVDGSGISVSRHSD